MNRSSRRAFLKGGVLVLAGHSAITRLSNPLWGDDAEKSDSLTIGLITDLHYADKPPVGSRYYRQTPEKLAEAAERMSKSTPDFVVELGDLIDAADSIDLEKRWLKRINGDFAATCKNRYYVLGNHCVDMLTKDEFLSGVEQEKSYYSFDRNGRHFIVLDACFRHDGEPYGRKNFHWTDANIPDHEFDWLKQDLSQTQSPVVVFAHQRLDVSNSHGVKNNEQVRGLLEESGKVQAVFQGHSHRNDYREINGIHYVTLVAMIEGSGAEHNGYSLLKIAADGTLELSGFREQKSYAWGQHQRQR